MDTANIPEGRFRITEKGYIEDTLEGTTYSAREYFETTAAEFDRGRIGPLARLGVVLDLGPVECARALVLWWSASGKPYTPNDAVHRVASTLRRSRPEGMRQRWLLQFLADNIEAICSRLVEELESIGPTFASQRTTGLSAIRHVPSDSASTHPRANRTQEDHMTIQRAIAEVEAVAEIRERLATRLDGLVTWLKKSTGLSDATDWPSECKISLAELNLAAEMTEASLRMAESYAAEALTAYEQWKSNLVRSDGSRLWGASEADSINMRTGAMLLRKTAAVLRSLATQHAVPGTVPTVEGE